MVSHYEPLTLPHPRTDYENGLVLEVSEANFENERSWFDGDMVYRGINMTKNAATATGHVVAQLVAEYLPEEWRDRLWEDNGGFANVAKLQREVGDSVRALSTPADFFPKTSASGTMDESTKPKPKPKSKPKQTKTQVASKNTRTLTSFFKKA
ncbi:hypothetical protein EV182_001513 [Spiromyces aspiralis]|uniref:Uncharacterized protein n=1 Tax=Spiromyces aspiralis TaxID=68401 RepID=A0ACC1HT02_9FUNG|nr:hypothetical protein EV182_001513 [Spiromyces aspiralis]